MGAFGEMLIRSWGGDINHYRGNSKPKSKEQPEEEVEDSPEPINPSK